MARDILSRCRQSVVVAMVVLAAGATIVDTAKADPKPLTMSVGELVTDSLIASVRKWASAPVITEALKSRNQGAGQLEQSEIDALDKDRKSVV